MLLNYILTPLLMTLVSLLTKKKNNGKPRERGVFPSHLFGPTHPKGLQTQSLDHKLPHLLPTTSLKETSENQMTRGGAFGVKDYDTLRLNVPIKNCHLGLQKELNLNEPLQKVEAGLDEGELLVIRRALSGLASQDEFEQRESIFHTRCTVGGKLCSLIIDG